MSSIGESIQHGALGDGALLRSGQRDVPITSELRVSRHGTDCAGGNSDDWERLKHLTDRFTGLLAYQPSVAGRAERLARRMESQEFHVAILGEFKRGKSTLVNALIGSALLPTGVVPLTTVATEVRFGSADATVVFIDGRRLAIVPENIGDYVTELGNPSNRLAVKRVEIGADSDFGVPGLVLVDTPGVASVNEHNTEAAREALLDADGAVVVLSADSPLSESEESLLIALAQRRARIFIVINKSDHLSPSELNDVRTFVVEHLDRLLGDGTQIYCVAARTALELALNGGPTDEGGAGFAEFRSALESFVSQELAPARFAAALGELERLGAGLSESIQIEEAAARLDGETLNSRVARFEVAASDGRRLLSEDRVLLDHDVAELAKQIEDALAEAAGQAARDRQPLLGHEVATVAFRQLDSALRDAVEASVREGFETLRHTAQARAEESWQVLAERFLSRVQLRVDELRVTASKVFDLHLPVVSIPPVGEQRDRFSYHFLYLESPGLFVGRVARSLWPTKRARRRAVRRAEHKLVEEFDKHAGRARYDMVERLNAAKLRIVEEMMIEFEQTEQSILAASGRARSLLELTEEEQRLQRQLRAEAMAVADDASEVVVRERRRGGS